MAFIPAITYPTAINPLYLGDGSEWLGGIFYRVAEDQTKRHSTGKVLSVLCTEFDQAIHNSEANGLFKKMVTLKDGVYLGVTLWCETNQVNGPVKYKVKSYNADGSVNPTVFHEMVLHMSSAGGGDSSCWPEDLRDHGFKIMFFTDYYDANIVPVPLVTEPYRFEIYIVFPNRSYSGGHADWWAMGDSVRSYSTNDWTNAAGAFPFINSVYSTTNVDAFMAALGITDGYGLNEAPDPDDPHPPQDEHPSGPGGGDGDYDPTSDPIDFPTLPTGGALHSGAIKAFVVSSGIMTAIFNELWNTSIFDIANWQKLLEAPLDSLIELSCLPVVPATGSPAGISLGNFETQQSAPVVTSQYLTIDCGTLNVKKYWGSALDYQPYTNVEIYLPFIGIRELKADDVVGYTIHVKYNIDVLTGDLTAQIKCGQSVLYKFNGNCKATVPVSSRVMDALRSFVTGTMGIALASTPTGVATATIAAAVNVAMSKTHVQRSGNISGAVGLLDDFIPYLIIHRPVQSLAQNFNMQKGYPSNITATLSSLRGYTEVEYVHLTGISGATDTELQEIESLLKEGVII